MSETVQQWYNGALIRNLVKLVIVGDGGAGKTSLLIAYCCDEFPFNYVPVVFDTVKAVPFAEETYHLQFWDTGGGEGYDTYRPLSYLADFPAVFFHICHGTDKYKCKIS